MDGETITTTPTHPFYVPQKGWTEAVQLRAGDILVTCNGEYVVVEQVQHEILETPVTVYNFEVEDFHTYYVAANEDAEFVLVHNSKCGGNGSAIDPAEFEKANNLPEGYYHRKVKPYILNHAKPNYKVGHNPDILINRTGGIGYQPAKNSGLLRCYMPTGLNIKDVLEALKK